MATTQSTSRYADHRAFAQAGANSPFRSDVDGIREAATDAMLIQRERELASLAIALSEATTPRAKKNLRLRIQATKNNIAAWEHYDGERVSRAVMTPYVRPNPLVHA